MIRKTFYYPAQCYNVPEIIKIPPIDSISAPPASPSKHSDGILSSGDGNHSIRPCQPLRKATAFLSNRLINYETPEAKAAGRRRRWRHPHPSDPAQAAVPSAPQQSCGEARREGARLVPRWAQGAGLGGAAAAGSTELSEGVRAGKGDPPATPCREGRVPERGGAVTPRRRMEPPSRSAQSLLRKRLCRNRTGALRFGGLMLSFNQPAAPIHLFLITLQLLPQGDKGKASVGAAAGPARMVTGKHAPTLAPLAPAIPSSRSPPPPEPDEGGGSREAQSCAPLLPVPPTRVLPPRAPGPGQVPGIPAGEGAGSAAGRGEPEFVASTSTPYAQCKHDPSLPKLNKDSPRGCGRPEPAIQWGEVKGTARKNTKYLQINIFQVHMPNPKSQQAPFLHAPRSGFANKKLFLPEKPQNLKFA